MSDAGVVETGPARAREVAAFLASRGAEPLPPGPTFVAVEGGVIVAAARLGLPPAGDGHHVEHVRTLHAVGAASRLACVASAAVAAAARASAGRVTAEATGEVPGLEEALASAGLEREVVLAEGWAPRGAAAPRPLVVWGLLLPAARRWHEDEAQAARAERPRPRLRGREGVPDGLRIAPVTADARPALEAFLDGLAPGRSYPPGTLLSESERLETRRRGDLDARWILARAPDGSVVGGAVLQGDARPERAHVRRVHLDVVPAWRRRGVATALLREAAREAGRLGILRLEADPRAGNRGACGALSAAGFEVAGRERAAWRVRAPGNVRDEDVIVFVAPGGDETGQPASS